MSVTVKLDSREFNQAMKEYVAVTKKDSAVALNRQARNFCIKGAMSLKKADAGQIRGIANKDWWPKVVAAVVKKQAGGKASSKAFQSMWASGEKSKHKKGAFKLDKEERSYVKLAKQISKTLIGSRVKAIGFTKWFFLRAAREISSKTGQNAPSGKAFSGIESSVTPALLNRLQVKFESFYTYKRRGAQSAQSEEKQLTGAIGKALSATVEDMKRYTQDQLAKRAGQYSGKKS